MNQKKWLKWMVPISATLMLIALLVLTIHLKSRYDETLLPTVTASQSYQDAVKNRNDLSKTINLTAIGLFLLAVAPLLRRKDADITLDFSNELLVWTLICVVLGALGSIFCHLQFLSEIIDNLRLGGSNSRIPSGGVDKIPDLFDPAVGFWFDLQKGLLVYSVAFFVICLLWAQPWKRHVTAE